MNSILKLGAVAASVKRVAAGVELTRAQLLILSAVGSAGKDGLPQKMLLPLFATAGTGAATSISQATKALDWAIEVKRKVDDARIRILHLTKDGAAALAGAEKLFADERKALVALVGEAKVKQLESVADEIAAKAGWPA